LCSVKFQAIEATTAATVDAVNAVALPREVPAVAAAAPPALSFRGRIEDRGGRRADRGPCQPRFFRLLRPYPAVLLGGDIVLRGALVH
jgi:hypothetical protein